MYSYSPLQGHYLSHRISLEGIDDHALTRSLTTSRVDMNPHQVDAALFALRSPLTKGVLLADEVGLGKTIEAGLVIAQRWAERKRRILLIVPASLRKQWQQELQEKFGLSGDILEAATYRAAENSGIKEPFNAGPGVAISSYEFAARHADEVARVHWDLVVIDEAHRLRNVYKRKGSSRAKDLKEALKNSRKLLLTATPLQNSLMELYGIVSVADETHFGGEAAFRSQYARAASVGAYEDLRTRLAPICHRTLRRQVQEAGHINFTRRNVVIFSFDPPSLEVELYEKVSAFLQRKDTISYGDRTNALVILQVRKILGSSTFAVAGYLRQLLARLEKKLPVDTSVTGDVETMSELIEELDEDGTGDGAADVDPEALAREIAEIRSFLALAESIGQNAKGEKLISQLPPVLDEIEAKGGNRKAVIFTESVRTQTYLAGLLSDNGYAGQIVLLNGSNSDAESKALFAVWRERHAGSDKISGSKSADTKAAIIDAFRSDDKTILIATESGAEGINLQFCSLVINFDLPWNPQRVEQRIGRCHRYGQKIDVTVVNMLNLKNRAEERILQLLREKFHLFEGVFGSSDEVLGIIASGADFEKMVLDIVQHSRTEEEIAKEFDALSASLQDTIDADLQNARAKLLENMDRDVIGRLKDRQNMLNEAIGDFNERLLLIARAEMPSAVFDRPESTEFHYDGKIYSTHWPIADENDWQFFRLAEGTLASSLVDVAKERAYPGVPLAFSFKEKDYPFPGRFGDVQSFGGKSGWMKVYKARVATSIAVREELLLACATDDGTHISPETADRILRCPSEPFSALGSTPPASLDPLADELFAAFDDRIKKQNFAWLEEEEDRLDNYARDLAVEIDAQIDELEAEIDDLRHRRRRPEISMEEKLALGKQIKGIENDIDDLKLSKHDRRRQIRQQVSDMLDEAAAKLNEQPERQLLFTLRWSLV